MRDRLIPIATAILAGGFLGLVLSDAASGLDGPNFKAAGKFETQFSDEETVVSATAQHADAISREVSVFRPWRTSTIADAISREVSVYREVPCEPPACYMDAISREVSVFKPWPVPQITDAISREVSAFSVIPITLGTPYAGNLSVGSFLYFRVTTPGDETVRVTMHHDSPTAMTELLASFASTPDSLTAQFAGEPIGTGTRELVIPTTQAGTYFILARSTTDSNPNASKSFEILATTVVFGIDRVEPATIGAGDEVTLRIRGAQLDRASHISLRSTSTGNEIEPVKTTVLDAASARLRFNLRGSPLGPYDLVADSSTGQVFVLEQAVTLDQPDEMRLHQEIVPSPLIRRSHGAIQGTTNIVLRNPTNVDVPFVFLEVFAPVSTDLTLTLDTPIPEIFAETSYYEVGELILESVGPGEERRLPIRIDLDRGYANPTIPVFAFSTILSRQQLRDGFLLGSGGEIDKWLERYRDLHGSTTEFETEIVPLFREVAATVFDDFGFDPPDETTATAADSNRPLLKCKKLCRYKKYICTIASARCLPFFPVCVFLCDEANEICLYCCQYPCDVPLCRFCPCPPCDLPCGPMQECRIAWYLDGVLPRCEKICVPSGITPYDRSADPNEKGGVEGFGKQQFVRSAESLAYRVYFENMETATAAAAEVTIIDEMDQVLDMSTLQIREFNFAATTVRIPEGRATFEYTLDLSAHIDLLVQLQAVLDSVSRRGMFVLRALDPETRQLPSELDRGFLPPNDDTGRGEGYVEFMVKPLASTQTGTVIRNTASITFDYNDPITTNEVFNTIDAGAPTSTVEPLATESATPFVVRWSAEDDAGGCGVAVIDIFVKTDDGPFEPWLTSAGDWAWFDGVIGKTYSFYAVGRDFVGNVEDAPATPDAVTTVTSLRCPGDANYDATADLSDHLLLVSCLQDVKGLPIGGPDIETASACAEADLNLDRRVDLRDFAILQRGFQQPCPP